MAAAIWFVVAQKNKDDSALNSAPVFASAKILPDKDTYFEYEIVGESFYQKELNRIVGPKTEESVEITKEAQLKRDLNNQHDKNAVAVRIDGLTVGYLNKHDAKDFCQLIKRNRFKDTDSFNVDALIVGGWKRKGSEGSFGVKLNMPEDIDSIVITRY